MNTLHPTFRWFERGHGEPVVLLHGLMGTMDQWDSTLEALAPMCRAMAPEVPILDEARAEASVEGLTHHIGALMDALDLPPAVVGGNSLGGHLALELALRYPARVSGLILTGSSGLFERSFTRGVPHVPTAAFVREKMEEIFYDVTLVTPSWVESVRRTLTTRASALRVLHVARSAKRSNLEGRLAEIRVPTLLVWGKDDRITPPEVVERFRALLPDAQLELIANCGHALPRPQGLVGGRAGRGDPRDVAGAPAHLGEDLWHHRRGQDDHRARRLPRPRRRRRRHPGRLSRAPPRPLPTIYGGVIIP